LFSWFESHSVARYNGHLIVPRLQGVDAEPL